MGQLDRIREIPSGGQELRRMMTVNKKGYKPTTLRGKIRKRSGKSGVGSRTLGDREALRHSDHVDDRRRAQRQTGERYHDPINAPRKSTPRKRVITRDTLEGMTKAALVQLGEDENIKMAKRWGKGKMIDTLDAHFSERHG